MDTLFDIKKSTTTKQLFLFLVTLLIGCFFSLIPLFSATPADTSSILTMLQQATEHHSALYLIALAFLAGLLTSFTPCIYPMLPVTLGILHAHNHVSLLRKFFAAVIYVGGIAAVYSTLGYLSAKSGLIFGKWTTNPWVILFVVAFFLYLAGSMIGLYELYLPRFLMHRTDTAPQGSLLKIFLFGIISGTIASPCITPSLALVLGLVAKTHNPPLGFLMLFAFSIGMGILLIIVGTFSQVISLLPGTGAWMNEIKKSLGFIMLYMTVYFAQPLLGQGFVALMGYISISISGALYFTTHAFKASPRTTKIILALIFTAAAVWSLSYLFRS